MTIRTTTLTTILALLLTLLSPHALRAEAKAKPLEVKVQSGEKWWGLVVDPAVVSLPFEGSFVLSTTEFSPTQYRANLLLSNRGRYIWSDQPLTITFNGKQLTALAADGTAPKLQKSGRTLREAYLMSCHRHFPPKEVGASAALFESPIYEIGGPEAILVGQEDVVAFADMLSERGAPSGTLLLPIGWNSTSGAFTFDPEAYPDPRAMIDTLHARGMKVMLTVTPYVMAAGRGYHQSLKEGALMVDGTGHPIVFQTRMGYTACRTLTPELMAGINSELRRLQTDYGVDGFYFDTIDALALLEGNKEQLASHLSLWNKAGEGIDVALYSTPVAEQLGSVASSLSTTRNHSWQSLAESLERAIDASVLGFTRTSLAADLEIDPTDEALILRTAQLAALLPVAVIPYSAWSIAQSEPLCEILRWRADHGADYLALAKQSTTSAEPIIRHLEYQFPRTGFTNCREQFMVGGKWLVAPVTDPSGVRMVRLPKGRWKELDSGRTIKGPRVIDVNVTDGHTPIYERVEN